MAKTTQRGIEPSLPRLLGNTVVHSGGVGPIATTSGTDTTPVVTETYICEVDLPHSMTLTGVKLLNGSAAAGNITAYLYDAAGVPMAKSASTAQSGTAAYQTFAFTTPIKAPGPARYFIGIQCDSVSARFRTHAIGNFIAGKKTGETYGTGTTITTSTFTAGLGPIADVYA